MEKNRARIARGDIVVVEVACLPLGGSLRPPLQSDRLVSCTGRRHVLLGAHRLASRQGSSGRGSTGKVACTGGPGNVSLDRRLPPRSVVRVDVEYVEKTALSTHSHHVTGCRSLFRPQCCHCNLPLDLQPGVGDRRSDTKSTANQGQTQSPPPGSQPRPSPRKQDTRRRQQAASKAEQNYETANPPCV